MPAHQSEPEPPGRTQATAAPGISAAPAQRMLALQRQIGNRAVGALLSRAPAPKSPPKMPAPKPPELRDGIYAVVPGVGTILLNSAQLGTTRQTQAPSGSSSSREATAPTFSDITLSSEQGDHSDKLFRAALQGDNLGAVEIRFVKGGKAYLTITLHNAMITSFNFSGSGGASHERPMESWTLNGDKIEYKSDQTAADAPG